MWGLSESLPCSLTCLRVTLNRLYCSLFWREELSESAQFQGLFEAILSCLLSVTVFLQYGENCYTTMAHVSFHKLHFT